ncbi:MAG: hypothetical protein AABX73_04515, partial [Nanoarchaeota archaeon]
MNIPFDIEQCEGIFSRPQLESLLYALPLTLRFKPDIEREMPQIFESIIEEAFQKLPTKLIVSHRAQLVSLRPQNGARICDGSFHGENRNAFSPSRVFDETQQYYGEACSYSFNTADLELPFSQSLSL